MAGGAGEPLLPMGGVGEIFQFRGVARPAERRSPAQAKALAVNLVAIKTADVLLPMLAEFPLVVGCFVAVFAHVGGNGDRHFVRGMGVGLGAMAGFAGDALVRKDFCPGFPARAVAGQAIRLGAIHLPRPLKHLGRESAGVDGGLPLLVFLGMTGGAIVGAGELGTQGGGKEKG